MMKPRSTIIIVLSSLVIASVLAFTLFGYYAYLEWQERTKRHAYLASLRELNAKLYSGNIPVTLTANLGFQGMVKARPTLEGTIKNKTNKKVYAIVLKVLFIDKDGKVVYMDTFEPIGGRLEVLVDMGYSTKNFLKEGDSLSFTHRLKNCPIEVIEYLNSKLKFAKSNVPGALRLEYRIEEVDII